MNTSDELFSELSRFDLPTDIGRVELRAARPGSKGVLAYVNNWSLSNIDGIRKGAEIIRRLASRFGFEVVFVDGAEGAADFSVWDRFHPLMREWFAERLMLRGYMSPAELAVVLFPEAGIELFGIEDRDLYKANWRAARKVAPLQVDTVAALKRFQTALSNQTSVLSLDTRRLIERQDAYEAAYQAWLDAPTGKDDAEHNAMKDARDLWLDFVRLCVRWLGISIPLAAAKEMQECGYPLAEGSVSAADDGSEAGAFLEENPSESKILSRLSLHLATVLARTDCDRAFLFLRRAVNMLIPAFKLSMGMEETTEFLQGFYTGTKELRRSVTVLTDGLREMGLAGGLNFPEEVETLVKAVVQYHSLGMLRGVRMAENIAREMNRRKIDRAMVVQSGFQFPIIAGVLSQRYQIETLQITPKVVGKQGVEAYRARLMEESGLDEEDEASPSRPEIDGNQDGVGEASPWLRHLQDEALREWQNLPLSEHAGYVVSTCQRDHKTILIVDCYEGELLLAAAKRCRSAFVMGVANYSTTLIPSLRNPDMLQLSIGRENLSRRVVLVNSLSRFLPFLNSTFDLILSDSLDQIFNAGECRTAVRECVRVLTPGGQIRIISSKWSNVIERTLQREGLAQIARLPLDDQFGSRSAVLLVASLPTAVSSSG